MLQPITVRKTRKNFIIVMGERRYRASKLADKNTIPCIVKAYTDSNVLEVQIIENLQRQDVEPTCIYNATIRIKYTNINL
ncbi:ParB/RepB/Spo0J family partition protein [Wocania ichthyoenteri]|uniref:ParB/RepB/Spo0J family partition protein n=1 Tax=Wocania ichthyoenteri TaxID=1230531 RepID=UPI0021D3249A|nr:ParB/RepB/Spo0J family partition protein [Wocania ichthyoenteri]